MILRALERIDIRKHEHAWTQASRRGRQRLDRIDDVVDRADVLECLRLNLPAGDFLERQEQVDGVDAVEVEIGVQVGVGHDLPRLELELIAQHHSQVLQYFFAGFRLHFYLDFSGGSSI